MPIGSRLHPVGRSEEGETMRLGGFFRTDRAQDLPSLCDRLDVYGLSAIPAPARLAEMSPAECAAFGERARELGLVVGEATAR